MGKARFPEAQHMLRQIQRIRDFADRSIGLRDFSPSARSSPRRGERIIRSPVWRWPTIDRLGRKRQMRRAPRGRSRQCGQGAPWNKRPTLFVFFVRPVASVDLGLQHVGRLEHHHPARQDRHLDAGLRVAAHALALGADDERTEARKLDGFPPRGRVADFVQHRLDQFRRLRCATIRRADTRFQTDRRALRSFPIRGQVFRSPSRAPITITPPPRRTSARHGPAQDSNQGQRLCRVPHRTFFSVAASP